MYLQNKKRNICLMYAICFFQGIVLYASISTLYRQARGLSLAEYALIDGFSSWLLRFPSVCWRTGSDIKKTLIFSNGLYLFSKVIF